MKNKVILFLTLLLVISCNNKQDELDKDISLPVSVLDVKPQGIEKYVEVTGNVEPLKEAELKNQVAGIYTLKINAKTGKPFALGDYVEEGTVIVALEDEEYVNSIKLESLELNLEITKQTHDKQTSLYEKGGVTLSDMKNAEVSYIDAKYSVEDAKISLAKLNVAAPFSGVIVELPYHTPGVRVESSTDVATIMNYSSLLMEVDFPEKNLDQVKKGQEVKVTNYSLPNDTLSAAITQLSPAINSDSRSFKGMLTINNPNLLLRPGMFVKANVIVSKVDSTIVLPKDIILTKERGNSVFIINKGLAMEKVVEFGIENPNEVQILSGVEVGDQVVVKGFETLRDQSKIKVVK